MGGGAPGKGGVWGRRGAQGTGRRLGSFIDSGAEIPTKPVANKPMFQWTPSKAARVRLQSLVLS